MSKAPTHCIIQTNLDPRAWVVTPSVWTLLGRRVVSRWGGGMVTL